MKDLVVGIDSSTQSTKSIAWKKDGEYVCEGREQIKLHGRKIDYFEQETEDWWNACKVSLRQLTEQIDPHRIAGIGITNQRETVGFLDGNMEECSPAIVWLDQRCRESVSKMSAELGSEFIHETTGRPVDITPVIYRLAWMKEHLPEIYGKTAYFCDVHGFLVWKLTGEKKTSWASADPFGGFDIRKKEWCKEILDYLQIDEHKFFKPEPPSTKLGTITAEAAKLTGLIEGTPIYAGGGDGQCAGLGVNCTTENKAYINLGTAVVFGVWNQKCRNHPGWRTEIAVQDEGYIYESCLISGAFLINWFVDQFFKDANQNKDFFKHIDQKVESIPIGSNGLLTLPYWGNAMNPYWDIYSSGCIIGLKGSHKPEHLYRSILEGIALEQAQALEFMENDAGLKIASFTAIGGGANSPVWTKILANCLGKPIEIVDVVEASSLGAAMIAAKGAGWYKTISDASNAMKNKVSRRIEVNPKERPVWENLLQIYKKIYVNNKEITKDLAKFLNEYE